MVIRDPLRKRNMKKIYSLMVALVLLTGVAFGWDMVGVRNVHEPVNNKTVDYFNANFRSQPKYLVASLDEEIQFSGVAWHSDSDKNIKENNGGVTRTETFRNWVWIGGVDADVESDHGEKITISGWEPFKFEKPLRHFYDPVNTPRYLTDFSATTRNLFQNPQMDHVTWALHASDNPWSFDQGLKLYKEGMEATIGTAKQSIKIPMGYEPGAYFNGDKPM